MKKVIFTEKGKYLPVANSLTFINHSKKYSKKNCWLKKMKPATEVL